MYDLASDLLAKHEHQCEHDLENQTEQLHDRSASGRHSEAGDPAQPERAVAEAQDEQGYEQRQPQVWMPARCSPSAAHPGLL
jgi:hypothetical protein